MKLARDEFFRLLNIGGDVGGAVVPMTKSGDILDRIQPECLLYIACGDDTIVYIDADMKPQDLECENV